MLARPDRLRWMIAAAVVALLASGCAKKKRKPPAPAPPRVGRAESGIASWYGYPYHGRRGANGEIYDMEKLSAAHRTLPFDTWVHVHNLDNGKDVEVRITDRGPFAKDRIIDLSKAAARKIDMIGPGLAKVRVEAIRAPEHPGTSLFGVQIGAFRDKSRAEGLREQMRTEYGAARLVLRDGSPPLWRVIVGDEATEEAAGQLAEKIRAQGGPGFVVRVDEGDR